MEYRLLGRTGVKVSPFCLGPLTFGYETLPIGGGTVSEDAYRMAALALDKGTNFVDTANVYSREISEEITGEALKRSGQRDRVILATKVDGSMADNDPNMQGTSNRHVIEQGHASLRRL